jgi:hypothetical protein
MVRIELSVARSDRKYYTYVLDARRGHYLCTLGKKQSDLLSPSKSRQLQAEYTSKYLLMPLIYRRMQTRIDVALSYVNIIRIMAHSGNDWLYLS